MFTNFFTVNNRAKKRKKAVDTNGFVQLVGSGSFFKDLDDAYRGSPTATMARLKFVEFCVPDNLSDEYQKLWKRIANDYIDYGYFLIHQSYDIDGIKTESKYLSPKKYLVKDLDDNDNASSFKNIENGTVFPAFNDNVKVVREQILKNGYENFKGQIYMYNDSSNPYRLTPLITVIDWMKTEANSSVYVEKACNNAMFGNNLFVIKKSSSQTQVEIDKLFELREALVDAKGVDNSSQNFMLEWEGDIDDIPKLLSKTNLSNEDVNIDLLNGVDDKASEKICIACYGFPKILISQSEGIFGNSGESIKVATEQWSKTCKREAMNILDGFNEIGFKILKEVDVKVEDIAVVSEVFDDVTLAAQATLKGSAGGVQTLLSIQLGVSQGTTTYDSAITMLYTLYGFDKETSAKLLGQPKKETNDTTINTDSPAA